MRLPNGYGTIYKLTGNRRRPWVVKKSIEGKQAEIRRTTTCNLIRLLTSLSGPLKDINDFVRFHVVVGLVTTRGTYIPTLPSGDAFMVN